MTRAERAAAKPAQEHSVPWFWPLAAGIELAEEGMKLFGDNLKFAAQAEGIVAPPAPDWATKNEVLLDLDTMRVRNFSPSPSARGTPVLIDAPYAGHSSTIADYAAGQSLVETFLDSGLQRVFVTDWKSATATMKYLDIDAYLAELNVAVGDLGDHVHIVGLCQGGWMAAMFAARFPRKVASLVLAGSPIDTHAGDGAIKKVTQELPMRFFEEIVAAGDGLMRGRFMLAGWKNMHPGEQYVGKYLDLYAHIEDESYVKRTERFERWYENPVDLPGRWYLQAIRELFKENQLTGGKFVALGRRLSLKAIEVPIYLLAGAGDDITTRDQVFNAEHLVGTPKHQIVKRLVPGGHIGLFMGEHTLRSAWPEIAGWIERIDAAHGA